MKCYLLATAYWKAATDLKLTDDNWLKNYLDEFQQMILTFTLNLWTISSWSYLTR